MTKLGRDMIRNELHAKASTDGNGARGNGSNS